MVKGLDNIISKLQFFCLVVISAIPVLPYGILSASIISYSILSLSNFFLIPKKNISKKNINYFFSQIAFYIIFCISIFYSENKVEGAKLIQHSLPILIFPILSLINLNLSKKKFNILIKSFIFSSLLLSLYITSFLFLKYEFIYIFNSSVVYHVLRAEFLFVDVHPIYTSIFFVFSIILILNKILNNANNNEYFKYISAIIILLFPIIILASKTIFIILIFSIFTILLVTKKVSAKAKIYSTLSISILFLLILQLPTINARFNDFFNSIIYLGYGKESNNSTFLRIEIFRCAIDVAFKNIFYGVGLGDVQEILKLCYLRKEIPSSIMSAHNFYLRLLASCGIIGLVLFLYSIYCNLKLSIKRKKSIFLIVTVIFSILLFFEDYLLRAYGVSFYCLVNHVFYLSTDED